MGFVPLSPPRPPRPAASVAAQRALGEQDWSAIGGLFVRMAVHTGTADERDGDYFGPALNRVSRLLKIAHGEQILVSSVTAELVRGDLESGVVLSYLGRYELAGFSEHEAVHQLVFSGGRTTFSPIVAPGATQHNLPEQVSSYVRSGRIVEDLVGYVQTSRLVTLCGVGGVGKTRTALQAARQMTELWRDGEWFVELEPLSDLESIVQTSASILRIRDVPGRPHFETLLEYLGPRRMLLILDNCEHVVEAVATFVRTLLSRCRHVNVLATSREALRIAGERVVIVNPLASPTFEPGRLPSVRELEASPAVALFLDRARSVEPGFRFEDTDWAPVQQICARLDGLPLALELAAARVRTFRPRELAKRLEDRFRILTHGPRDSAAHHRTLHALVDWSWSLLAQPERILFRRLAVFAGGWTLEAAEAVTAGESLQADDVLDLLTGLSEKSLVYSDTGEDTRFRFLDTIRAFAAEKLRESDEHLILARAHAKYYAAAAAQAESHLRSQAQDRYVEAVTRDIGNYRLALDVAGSAQELRESALVLCAGLARYWLLAGARFEGRTRMEPHLKTTDGDANVFARAACGAAILSLNLRDHTTFVAQAQLASDVSTRCDDAWSAAYAAVVHSAALSLAPHVASRTKAWADVHDRARRCAERTGDAWLLTYVEYARSRRAHGRDTDQERASLERAIDYARRSGDKYLFGTCALYLAHALETVDPVRSIRLLAEAAATSGRRVSSIAAALESTVRLKVYASAFHEAARFMGAAAAFREAAAVPALRVDPNEYRSTLVASLGKEEFDELFEAGRTMSADEAIEAITSLGESPRGHPYDH